MDLQPDVCVGAIEIAAQSGHRVGAGLLAEERRVHIGEMLRTVHLYNKSTDEEVFIALLIGKPRSHGRSADGIQDGIHLNRWLNRWLNGWRIGWLTGWRNGCWNGRWNEWLNGWFN